MQISVCLGTLALFSMSSHLTTSISWRIALHIAREKYLSWKVLILAGLEPAIPWFVVRCLIHWATGPHVIKPLPFYNSISPFCNMQRNIHWCHHYVRKTSKLIRQSVIIVFIQLIIIIWVLTHCSENTSWRVAVTTKSPFPGRFVQFSPNGHGIRVLSFLGKLCCNELTSMVWIWLHLLDGRVAHW